MLQLIFFLLMAFQAPAMEGAKLDKLVQERDQLHAEWKASESQKTGIFGNRTKKNMIETNAWMERIISKDNQIMDELRMIGEIETTTIAQEKEDYKSITLQLEEDVQTLKRALAERDKEIEEKVTEGRLFEWASVIFFLTSLSFGYWVYSLKKS